MLESMNRAGNSVCETGSKDKQSPETIWGMKKEGESFGYGRSPAVQTTASEDYNLRRRCQRS